jgi:hypothetical protein
MRWHRVVSSSGSERQEATLLKGSQHLRNAGLNRCAVCDGKFGLVRYYTWRSTGLCSRKCRDRYRTRQVGGLRWLCEGLGV